MRWNRLSPGETGKAPRPFLVRPDLTPRPGRALGMGCGQCFRGVRGPSRDDRIPTDTTFVPMEAKIAQMSVSRPMREP
jgi:hypothetical protein